MTFEDIRNGPHNMRDSWISQMFSCFAWNLLISTGLYGLEVRLRFEHSKCSHCYKPLYLWEVLINRAKTTRFVLMLDHVSSWNVTTVTHRIALIYWCVRFFSLVCLLTFHFIPEWPFTVHSLVRVVADNNGCPAFLIFQIHSSFTWHAQLRDSKWNNKCIY